MTNLEVEIKSFVSKNKFDELMSYFKLHGKFIKEDYQETYYFQSQADFRIQKSDFFSKIILKKGKLHDEIREETEVTLSKDDFDKLKKIISAIGLKTEIKWIRRRYEFLWNKITVTLDNNLGTGYFVEMELPCNENNKEEALQILKKRANELSLSLTPLEELEKRFKWYKENWREILGEKEEI